MKSSYRIFRIFGISIELHITFILLLLILFTVGWLGESFIAGLQLVLLFILLFTIVVAHEISHSIVALMWKIKVPRITLLPIGGMANIEIPEKPHIELIMSIAGPLLNIVLSVICFLIILFAVSDPIPFLSEWKWDVFYMSKAIFNPGGILKFFLYINIVLAVFNLLPIFPMDGGRILRALLALFIEYTRATSIAVNIGQYLSLLMIILGIFSNPWIAIIGVLIYFAGGQELKIVKLRHALSGLTAGEVAIRNFDYVCESMSLKEFLENIAKPHISYYPVVDSFGNIVGMFSIDHLKDIDHRKFEFMSVGELTDRDFISIDSNEKISERILKLLESEFVFVVDEGRIIGYLTPNYLIDLARFRGVTKKYISGMSNG